MMNKPKKDYTTLHDTNCSHCALVHCCKSFKSKNTLASCICFRKSSKYMLDFGNPSFRGSAVNLTWFILLWVPSTLTRNNAVLRYRSQKKKSSWLLNIEPLKNIFLSLSVYSIIPIYIWEFERILKNGSKFEFSRSIYYVKNHLDLA